MRRLVALIVAVVFFGFLFLGILDMGDPVDYTSGSDYYNPMTGQMSNTSVPQAYLNGTEDDTGSSNVVTAVVVEYRGFDTLGEVTVLFTAATGLALLLSYLKRKGSRLTEPNFIVSSAATFVLPFIVLVGTYVFVHGHLTPGGGFPGGAIIASGFLLLLMAYPAYALPEKKVSLVESLAGMTFTLLGLLGLVLATFFLENYLPLGDFGTLFSAGVIPLIYIAVGFKVGSELSSIIAHLKGGEE